MTEQPRLHHLLDRMRRGVLLPEEADQLATAVTMLLARVADQDGAAGVAVSAVRLMNEAGAQRDAAEARVTELETELVAARGTDLRTTLTPPADDYEQTTGHQVTCCAGFTDTCTCATA
ncbi:hypothetical protein ACIREK_31020 [Streptomyces sp. NPDC102415]|uniref:hypothetical protein n=1 Tax=Streptomyces sp. NPDC102415 TaxID=3366173 RepID=UPI0038126478